ncbi:hypothetical protein E3P99_03598 [Wallemia hederae]|uniref:Replication factor C subunit 1 n=1 Tax=Wallemia hederae TaxID=1540922 RepID=A0A4T0FFN5_9BASI|nr:hypothetical protein E3P99_03598 [Wallemia hederae]
MAPKRKTVVISDSDEDAPNQSTSQQKKPKPSASSATTSNFSYRDYLKRSGPENLGSRSIPQGTPGCLSGLTLVFTGEFDNIGRDAAVEAAKRYGAKVTAAPSGRTSYVVLGREPGPKKLQMVKDKNLKTLNEDEFCELIANSKPSEDPTYLNKVKKEEAKIKKDAEEMEAIEQERKSKAKVSAKAPTSNDRSSQSQLWTVKYAPTQLKDICGNKGQVEKISNWLKNWKSQFQLGFPADNSKNDIKGKRALLVHGAPGVGKTTAAHLAAKVAGFSPLELNASDVRSKKLIETTTNIDNTSIDSFFGDKADSKNVNHSTCLIFDECDGMSAGDRGGIGAMNALIKKTMIPIICICNDKSNTKMKPFQSTCGDIVFKRPEVGQVRSRIMSILHKEKMKVDSSVVDQLITGSQSDIRQVINMISTWKLLSSSMTYDEGKDLVQENQKYTIQTPWTIMSNLFSPYMFGPNNNTPLGSKADYYFQDHSLIPLFVQENYVKCNPVRARGSDGARGEFERMKLASKAAEAISDGDLVDSSIHGSQQQWGLMPLHAMNSTVRPASIMYGGFKGGYGRDTISFPMWLGQFSKTNKYIRALSEIQAKMRLKVSGERDEIRQFYYPTLWPRLFSPLTDTSPALDEVISLLDNYLLSKDDFDTMAELGVGDLALDKTIKAIPTKNKSAFTRAYNSRDHPVAFSRGQAIKSSASQAKDEVPDHEDVLDMEDDNVGDVKDDDENDKDDDVALDKLVRQPKKPSTANTKAPKRGSAAASRAKGKK